MRRTPSLLLACSILAACEAPNPGDSKVPVGSDPAPDTADTADTAEFDPTTTDDDGDGYSEADGDCDDTLAAVNPHAANEVPGDGVDQNCDGDDGCADVDCDGAPDLIFFGREEVAVFLQRAGDYNDTDVVRLPGGGTGGYGWAGDLDEDGFVDVVSGTIANGNDREAPSRAWFGSAAGLDPTAYMEFPSVGVQDVNVGDLDGDGWNDLVFIGVNYADGDGVEDTPIYVYWGGAEGFDAVRRTEVPYSEGFSVALGDVDGDGVTDLAACSYRGGARPDRVDVFTGGSSRTLPSSGFADEIDGCQDVTLSDVDRDERPELLVTSYVNGTSFSTNSRIYPNSGGTFSPSTALAFATSGPLSVTTGDFDADGQTDVAWPGYNPYLANAPTIVYSDALGAANATALRGMNALDVDTYDVNADGYDDLVATYYDEPTYTPDESLRVWYGGPAGLAEEASLVLPTLGAYDAEAADLDGDGSPEFVVPYFFESTGPQPSLIYWSDGGLWSRTTSLTLSFVFLAPVIAG